MGRLLSILGVSVIPAWLIPILICISLSAAGAAGWAVNGWRLEAQIAEMRASSAKAVADQAARVTEMERAAVAKIRDVEIHAYDAQKVADETLAENRRLITQLGGMYDPGKPATTTKCLPAKPATASIAVDQPATSRLSDEAAQFLLELAADADRAAIYATTGHEFALRNQGPR